MKKIFPKSLQSRWKDPKRFDAGPYRSKARLKVVSTKNVESLLNTSSAEEVMRMDNEK
ncbi:MAG: hypothetical protein V2A66_03985 [Pseudomonadota bacterium]